MSLQTDIIFVKALRANADLMKQLPAGDVYNTSIPLPDEELDNAPLPYVIVSFDGMQNDVETKDDPFEGESDTVTISIEVAARSRQELGELIEAVRKQIHEFFADYDIEADDYELIPFDYQLSAGPVNYESLIPGYWQVLTYQCDTNA